MEQRSTWGNAQGKGVVKNKIEYIPTMRVSQKSTEAEKESIKLWNLMVTTLRENGLMKEKGE
jgi:hypothetical protein